jgi:hypothetical protein
MTQASEMFALYIEAEKAVLSGKEMMLNGRKVVYEDLAMIRQGRMEWERKVQAESRVTSRKSRFAVADFSKLT